MKKVILSMLVVGSLMATSCKKAADAAGDAVDATTTVAGDAATATTDAAATAGNAVADGAKGVVDAAGSAIESAVAGLKLPSFADEKINTYVKEYSEYAKKYIDAKGDVLKNPDLAKTGVALKDKATELVKGMDDATKTKFDSVMNAIKAKMAPAAEVKEVVKEAVKEEAAH